MSRAEIDIFGTIGVDVTAQQMRAQLPSKGDVLVRINSGGGHAHQAIAMHAALMEHNGKVEVLVDGLAASAATLVMMAATTITVRSNALIMVHRPWGGVAGSSDDLNTAANHLDLTEAAMVDIYAARTRLPKNRIQRMLADETWMDAEEAKSLGFADRIAKPGTSPRVAAASYVTASILDTALASYTAAGRELVFRRTVDSILAEAEAAGVRYADGGRMARWVIQNHGTQAVAVMAEARRRYLDGVLRQEQ